MTININDYYLTEEDQDHILNFMNNAKYGIQNDKMILLLGSGKNGKTSLLNEIKRELQSTEFYCERLNLDDFTNKPDRKMIILDDDCLFHMRAADNELLKYLLCEKKENIIASTTSLKSIDPSIINSSLVIRMEHAFYTNGY